ncbi:MAG: dTDP-4-dehydrorhamnose reductase [Terrimicrobiaceae bacterium]
MSRILVLGGKGRLGAALARKWSKHHDVQALARPELDVADLTALDRLLHAAEFDVLVNCTGLTNVDRCETAREEATIVNALAPGVMAEAAATKGARFIHISTDYVFDGTKTSPYLETDAAHPLGHYGHTKLAGERAALEPSPRHLAVRVSWVFGPDKPSFVDMIIDRALANDSVEAIADKTSCPTSAEDVADWLEPFLARDLAGGLYHACNSGACTWRDYGQHALDCALQAGATLRARTVNPIPLAAMKNFSAPRPPHTAMDTTKLSTVSGLTPRPWQDALEEFVLQKFRHS